MTKNPVLNALSAAAYIVIVVLIMVFGVEKAPKTNILLVPIAMISLFTLSAAVMGYVFCYTPLMLYLEGKKKAAVELFLKTIIAFAAFTVLAFVLSFLGIFS